MSARDWQEAPLSLEKRKRAYAAAVARGADPACAPSPLLSRAALDRIIGAARLIVVTAAAEPEYRKLERERLRNGAPSVAAVEAADTEAVCRHVLNVIASALAHQVCNGARLRGRDHLRPLLKGWKRWQKWQTKRREGVAAARANLSALVEKSRDNARYPIPCPFAHSEAFERWLADESVAHGVESDLLLVCLGPEAVERAETKARRVSEATLGAVPERAVKPVRDLAVGGQLKDHDADRRLEMLLAIYWRLFNEEPNASIANKCPRAPANSLLQATDADGGGAARFVAAFEAECAKAIEGAGLGDPLRPSRPRPQQWAARDEKAVAAHIRDLTDPRRRGRCWERWALIGTASDAMLVRLASPPRRIKA